MNLEIRRRWYQVLEELLQAAEWRDADRETYGLMINIVGKEEGRLLYSEDLRNFPCGDLRVLDGLWVRYSEGEWGFSVQKRIWQECGSPGPYNSETKAQWEQFDDRCFPRNWRGIRSFSNPFRGRYPRLPDR